MSALFFAVKKGLQLHYCPASAKSVLCAASSDRGWILLQTSNSDKAYVWLLKKCGITEEWLERRRAWPLLWALPKIFMESEICGILSGKQYEHKMYWLSLNDANFHVAMLLCGQESHRLFHKIPGWLNTVWTADCLIKWDNPFLARPTPACTGEVLALSHAILWSASPFRSLCAHLEACQRTSVLH